ncbi:hypothetical protein GQ457_04G032640 [Hibiscus cannabinus]
MIKEVWESTKGKHKGGGDADALAVGEYFTRNPPTERTPRPDQQNPSESMHVRTSITKANAYLTDKLLNSTLHEQEPPIKPIDYAGRNED